jgi:prepilin-type N-terminal cleavage/methylation domain-containing protein
MMYARQNGQATQSSDSGLSLMEVIIAIAIISVVAISSVTLTINGIAAASMQERRQIAVTIASGAMENISAQTVATLYSGRTQSDVQAAFAANSATPGIAAVGGIFPTYQRWDAGASSSSTAQVPVTSPIVNRSGTLYSTTTLIGPCYQPTAGGNCTTLSSHPDSTDVVPGYLSLIRVVVVVRWTAGSLCTTSGCYYSTTTLIDPNKDLQWVTHV